MMTRGLLCPTSLISESYTSQIFENASTAALRACIGPKTSTQLARPTYKARNIDQSQASPYVDNILGTSQIAGPGLTCSDIAILAESTRPRPWFSLIPSQSILANRLAFTWILLHTAAQRTETNMPICIKPVIRFDMRSYAHRTRSILKQ